MASLIPAHPPDPSRSLPHRRTEPPKYHRGFHDLIIVGLLTKLLPRHFVPIAAAPFRSNRARVLAQNQVRESWWSPRCSATADLFTLFQLPLLTTDLFEAPLNLPLFCWPPSNPPPHGWNGLSPSGLDWMGLGHPLANSSPRDHPYWVSFDPPYWASLDPPSWASFDVGVHIGLAPISPATIK